MNNLIVTSSKIDNTSPFHIYYDLEIINNDTTLTLPPAPLIFNEIRNSPYLTNPELYYVTITRFNVETSSLIPVIIPQAQIGQNNVNLLIYSFTLKYKNYEYQQYINYIPSDLSAPSPRPPTRFQDLESNYYFVYTYQQFINMVNISLSNAVTGLNTLVVAGGDTLPSLNVPYFEFDPNAYLPILNCDEDGYSNTLTNPIEIYMNQPCYNLFNSFQVINYGYINITNGKNFKFVIQNVNNTNILQMTSYNAIQMYCESSPTPIWNPVSSILFTTSLLPVVQELVAVPKLYNAPSNLFNTGNNNNIQPLITDFTIPFTALNNYKESITYSPSGEYRLIDLYGNNSLSQLNLNVYWKDKFGGLHPVLLQNGCSASIKLLFRRKDYNNVTFNNSK